MRPFVHKFILPPVLLGIHAVLLLPIFLARSLSTENPHGSRTPGEARYDPLSPSLETSGAPRGGERHNNLLKRLQLQHSILFGVLGFVVIHVLKQFAGKIPLPNDPRRLWLAAKIEKLILLALGIVEEIWRWGLVRTLIKVEGGGGGFCGRDDDLWNPATHWSYPWLQRQNVDAGAQRTMLAETHNSEGYPGIWETVYVMGVSWSLVECGRSWYNVRPTSPKEREAYERSHSTPGRRASHSRSLPKRPLLGKRSRSDYSAILSDEEGSLRRSPFNPIFNSKRRDLGASRLRDCPPGELITHFANASYLDSGTYGGEGSTTACDDSLRHLDATPSTPKALGKSVDMRPGVRIVAQQLRTEAMRQDGISDNDYGDDEGSSICSSVSSTSNSCNSRSSGSNRSTRYEAQTPLLSSSLPYDPEQDRPHHEQQPLLQHQYRQSSYSTLNDSVTAALPSPGNSLSILIPQIEDLHDDDEADELVQVHEDDANNLSSSNSLSDRHSTNNLIRYHNDAVAEAIASEDQVEAENSPVRKSPQRRRIYPTFPSYSSSYNHSHFPTTPHHPPTPSMATISEPSTATSSRISVSKSTASPASPASPAAPAAPPPRRNSTHARRVYGISVDRLPLSLPVMWRTAGLLRHVGNGLLFAWAPSMVVDGLFRWQCAVVLLLLAAREGFYTVTWFGGHASRAGLYKSSTYVLVLTIVVYIISIRVWGII